jgi:hypothetical protein
VRPPKGCRSAGTRLAIFLPIISTGQPAAHNRKEVITVQMAFPAIAEPLQAAIAQAEAEMEDLNQARKDKKAELKQLRKSLADLNGGGRKKKAA